jgi:8-oxo-dGTP diphosphatase
MPHIHTEPGQHDSTASALIVRLDTEEPAVLLHMHKKHHKLMQPGGHIELTESPWQAISHEIVEETGYNLSQLKILQPEHRIVSLPGAQVHPMPVCHNTHKVGDDHFHSDIVYAFVVYDDPEGVPGEGESNDLRWFNLYELTALSDNAVSSGARIMATHVLEYYINEWNVEDLEQFGV